MLLLISSTKNDCHLHSAGRYICKELRYYLLSGILSSTTRLFVAVKSEFEMDMECELDQLITDYANEHLSGNVKRPEAPAISCQEVRSTGSLQIPCISTSYGLMFRKP